MKKIFIVLLLIISFSNIYAYENDYFEINIPDEYKIDNSKDDVYKWNYNNNYIAITINKNDKSNNISSYNDDDLEKEKNIMLEAYNDNLGLYNINATIENMTKEDINGNYSLLYDMYFPTSNSTGRDMYQKGMTITTKNYIFTLIYSSDKEIDDTYFSNLIKTFKIKDKSQINFAIIRTLSISLIVFSIIFAITIVVYKRILKA